MRPGRTNVTGLGDDELMIFDAIARAMDTLESLLRTNYSDWQNLSWTHGIDDETLEARLGEWVRRGWLEEDGGYYGLTAEGGAMWESERTPDWSRYVEDHGGQEMILIYATDEEVLRRYIEVMVEVGHFHVAPRAVEVRRVEHRPGLIGYAWRRFEVLHEGRAPVLPAVDSRCPCQPTPVRDHDETRRTWWLGIGDLIASK